MRTTHTRRRTLVTLALASLTLASFGAAAWHWRYTLMPLKIGVDGNYPPFTRTLPDGSVEGLEIDLAKNWCESMHARCTFQRMELDALLGAVADGRIDAAIASISITPERKRKVDFSIPYYQVPSAFIAPYATRDQPLAGTLEGRRIAVLKGSPREAWLRSNYPAAALDVVATEGEVHQRLRSGDAELGFGSMFIAKTQFLSSPAGRGFTVSGTPIWLGSGVGVALAKGRSSLRNSFDDAIQQLNQSGRFNTLTARYFDFPIAK